jgi:lipoprotein-anchoring transpeptidase ErfK/SrfK
MRGLVAIQVKSGVAVGLWVLGALCVGAEVRRPGFWYGKVGALNGRMPAGSAIGRSANLDSNASGDARSEQQNASQSPEPALQNNEVAAEQQASQLPAQMPAKNSEDLPTRRIVISIPDRRLALLVDEEVVKIYRVAVGAKDTPSPEGEYTIINHSVNPTFRHEDVEIAPGKDNPLGSRWMGLSLKGYGIHGTNVQSSVGKAASHGCFRMKKKDVEDLYARVQVGDGVSIRGERDELTAQLFGVADPSLMATKETLPPPVSAARMENEAASAPQNAASLAGGGGQ